jgi:hypothetical protein
MVRDGAMRLLTMRVWERATHHLGVAERARRDDLILRSALCARLRTMLRIA